MTTKILDAINPEQPSLFVRLSVGSADSLATAWDDLARTRKVFGKRSWLTNRCGFWYRVTEVTHTPYGWNVHDCLLITGTPDELETVRVGVIPQWLDSAGSLRIEATERGQYAEYSRSTEAVARYNTKGLLAPSRGTSKGETPRDLRTRWQQQGDADALELMEELEVFLQPASTIDEDGNLHYTRRSWQQRKRAPRG